VKTITLPLTEYNKLKDAEEKLADYIKKKTVFTEKTVVTFSFMQSDIKVEITEHPSEKIAKDSIYKKRKEKVESLEKIVESISIEAGGLRKKISDLKNRNFFQRIFNTGIK
jgi:hypothetical protein